VRTRNEVNPSKEVEGKETALLVTGVDDLKLAWVKSKLLS
jgi:hypothetical protein